MNSQLPKPGEDVAEACADALLAASAQALVLQTNLLGSTEQISIDQVLGHALDMLTRVIERSYREGAKPR